MTETPGRCEIDASAGTCDIAEDKLLNSLSCPLKLHTVCHCFPHPLPRICFASCLLHAAFAFPVIVMHHSRPQLYNHVTINFSLRKFRNLHPTFRRFAFNGRFAAVATVGSDDKIYDVIIRSAIVTYCDEFWNTLYSAASTGSIRASVLTKKPEKIAYEIKRVAFVVQRACSRLDTVMMSASRMEEAEDASVYEAEISVNETLRQISPSTRAATMFSRRMGSREWMMARNRGEERVACAHTLLRPLLLYPFLRSSPIVRRAFFAYPFEAYVMEQIGDGESYVGAMSRCYSRKPLGYPLGFQNGAERTGGREEGVVFPSSRESLPN
ncbi:hypothetical protein ALC60_00150 [Trachymyrmex zeteki]|uniref:Uncharacterized protein n=1 Tax=Mycetomoellerius zeteki TaxID=64791 RepID=A0A151XK32_9HYME|nr:hypothetical protein ALC60_00150 [Trachymyrmex zeteki]